MLTLVKLRFNPKALVIPNINRLNLGLPDQMMTWAKYDQYVWSWERDNSLYLNSFIVRSTEKSFCASGPSVPRAPFISYLLIRYSRRNLRKIQCPGKCLNLRPWKHESQTLPVTDYIIRDYNWLLWIFIGFSDRGYVRSSRPLART